MVYTCCPSLGYSIILQENQPGLFEIWLILGLEQEVYKMSLGHLVVSENKEMLKKTSH